MLDKNEEILKEITEKISAIMQEYPFHINWFLSLQVEIGITMYAGNTCAICVHDDMKDWIEDNNIQHESEKKGSTVN